MAQEACALINDDAMTTASDEYPDGLGYFLFWPVVCVVKGLVWQWKTPSLSHFGFGMRGYFEILVPTFRHCCMSTHDGRIWG